MGLKTKTISRLKKVQGRAVYELRVSQAIIVTLCYITLTLFVCSIAKYQILIGKYVTSVYVSGKNWLDKRRPYKIHITLSCQSFQKPNKRKHTLLSDCVMKLLLSLSDN